MCRKSVFYIDNIHNSYSVDDVEQFVSNLSVEVLSYFETKPMQRRGALLASGRKAFRLCINVSHLDRLLDATVWPDSVCISEWYF